MTLTCLIVTYNPPREIFQKQLASLEGYKVIIVDNGSDGTTREMLLAWNLAAPDMRKAVLLDQNRGIAAAQNIGMHLAIAGSSQFVLLLDHDSIPGPGLIAQMLDAAQARLAGGDRLAAIGARIVDPRAGKEHGFYSIRRGLWRAQRCGRLDGRLIPCEFLNASGSLIYLPAWEMIGAFNENFFIDHVETEWYMRARAKAYNVYGLCSGELEHYLGDDVVRYWLLGWRHMPRRSPRRHYTIIRNAIWMWKYPHTSIWWILNSALKITFTLFYFSIFDRERKSQFRKIVSGIIDGFLGETCHRSPRSKQP